MLFNSNGGVFNQESTLEKLVQAGVVHSHGVEKCLFFVHSETIRL